MSTEINVQFSLVDIILQRAVGMILDSTCLLVLMNLQGTRKYQTDKTISETIGMPLAKVTNCLSSLKEQKLIQSVPFQEMNGDKKKKTSAFYIDYRIAIENVVFKYCKIVNDINESRKIEREMYICKFVFFFFPFLLRTITQSMNYRICKIQYPYEEAVSYLDPETRKIHCPECGRSLELIENSSDREGNKRLGEVTFQMKMLKEDLEKLKSEYRNSNDYPIYSVPSSNDNTELIPKKHGYGFRHSKTCGIGSSGYLRTKIGRGPMPWEEDDDEKSIVIEEDSIKKKEMVEIDIYQGIEYLQNRFMSPDKTFNQTECNLIPESHHTSPIIPQIIKIKKTTGRRAVLRSVSAAPQL